MKSKRNNNKKPLLSTKEIALSGILLSLMIATVAVKIPTGLPVPITLQTFFVIAIALLLRPVHAFVTLAVYVLMGLAGIPVFAGFRGGLDVIVGPSGGFIIAFPISAFIMSLLRHTFKDGLYRYIVYSLIGTVIMYFIGTIQMANALKVEYWVAMGYNVKYFIGDIIKLLIAAIVCVDLNKHLHNLN